MAIGSVQNSINSAIISSTFGNSGGQNRDLLSTALNKEQENKALTTQDLLANTASQQIGLTSKFLNSLDGGDSLTNELVGLQTFAKNQQATDALPDNVGNVVGTIINELV
ncbi:hypothetical protein C2869_12730 [Saccharobesus litoralis]|uniref:Uncharacterized protein n=1 Tax=Saccharobesus litoralis TaxID=2172099 RepID=A0A2S0VSR2_9ALTE|nr:hypothetical protein [Saccharobesus litoralis]AWB67251.1 hypothetical protein C2869_12730 [Saccharobesus litoralis]